MDQHPQFWLVYVGDGGGVSGGSHPDKAKAEAHAMNLARSMRGTPVFVLEATTAFIDEPHRIDLSVARNSNPAPR